MKSKKSEEVVLQFNGENGEKIVKCKLFSIPLREDAVLQACIEFFADPEPCMLHRSAAMSRMYMELQEYFLKVWNEGNDCCSFSDIPEKLRSHLDILQFTDVVVYVS